MPKILKIRKSAKKRISKSNMTRMRKSEMTRMRKSAKKRHRRYKKPSLKILRGGAEEDLLSNLKKDKFYIKLGDLPLKWNNYDKNFYFSLSEQIWRKDKSKIFDLNYHYMPLKMRKVSITDPDYYIKEKVGEYDNRTIIFTENQRNTRREKAPNWLNDLKDAKSYETGEEPNHHGEYIKHVRVNVELGERDDNVNSDTLIIYKKPQIGIQL